MNYEYLTKDGQLVDFCRDVANASFIGFDTEFVSEDSYGPQLCLVQVAAGDRIALIDPLSIKDMTPFWRLLTNDGHTTLVHAGREEFRFCLSAVDKRPSGWFDVQIAAGFLGLEYPASYRNLISRLIGSTLTKGETRTDWRRRPLTTRQLDYAALDVEYLQPLHDQLHEQLGKLNRLEWLAQELIEWQDEVAASLTRSTWWRTSGISGLSPRQLAIVHNLWHWRDGESRARDCPPRRMLRDDLIVELARRQIADPQQVRAIRGMEYRQTQKYLPEIAAAIQSALDMSPEEFPRPDRGRPSFSPPLTVLGQFLNTALGSVCRKARLAPGIVGTVDDVRELVAYRLGLLGKDSEPPRLAIGWRADIVGKVVDDLLSGKTVIRIDNATSDHPLEIVPFPETH